MAASSKTAMTADIKIYQKDEAYLHANCSLGEGPFFEVETNTLRFVDIKQKKIHAVNLGVGPQSHKLLADLDISVGVTADVDGDSDHFVFGGKSGIGIFDRRSGTYDYIKRVWTDAEIANGKEERMRANDGGIDSRGRFWVGYMNDDTVPKPTNEGVLFRLDADLSLHRMLENVTIPNGITWSRDDKTMYMTDSVIGSIFAFDFDASGGTISNQRVFYQIDTVVDGEPDGHVIDEEDHLWTAVWGAGKVLRISPQGKLVAKISLPTKFITCPVFVGKELFITTAADEDEKVENGKRMGGSLFRCFVGVRGSKIHQFKYRV